MSIIQDLYSIFDKEQSKYLERKASTNLVVLELSNNLAFLREGLSEQLDGSEIIAGLSDKEYKKAIAKGVDLNVVQKKSLSKSTCGGVKEFEKYIAWSTEKMINNVYERISTLKKLNNKKGKVDVNARLKYLFKFLMLLMAHIQNEKLTVQR